MLVLKPPPLEQREGTATRSRQVGDGAKKKKKFLFGAVRDISTFFSLTDIVLYHFVDSSVDALRRSLGIVISLWCP